MTANDTTADAAHEIGSTQFATFYIDDLLFGIEVERVQEVLRHQKLTRIPHAPNAIGGLMNLRGQIVTAIDMRRCLKLPARADDTPPMNVVFRTELDEAVSLLVDRIDDVWNVTAEAFESPPDTMRGTARDLIRGVYKLEDRLLLVLDPKAIMRSPMVTARATGGFADSADVLRAAAEQSASANASAAPSPSLGTYERIGGALIVREIVEHVVEQLAADSELADQLARIDTAPLHEGLIAFFSEALGGPHARGARALHESFAALAMSESTFARFVDQCVASFVARDVGDEALEFVMTALAALRLDVVST